VQERKERRSAKYGHLRAAAAERAEEAQRIAEANRRSKERPPDRRRPNWGADGDAQVITVAVDEVPRDGAMSAERGWIGDRQPSVEWRDSHYSRQADRINTQPDPLRG
jgi:hypothetical protein